jgi:FAD/FMN-containing dehydrogenase
MVILRSMPAAVEVLLDRLHRSRPRPVCIDLLNPVAARYIGPLTRTESAAGSWVVAVGFEDNRDAVCWQVQQLVKELSPDFLPGLEAMIGESTEPLWQALVEFQARPSAMLTFKANLRPSAVATFCQQAVAVTPELAVQAHAGNGIVIGQINDLTLEQARALIKRLHQLIATKGNLVIVSCPSAWKKSLPIWGIPRGDWSMMRKIKQTLDPGNLFNPGRFVDGL